MLSDLWRTSGWSVGLKIRIAPVTIELAVGDLTRQSDLEAIVNAANNKLTMGGGLCGAIFHAAGIHSMREACDALSPIPTGMVVATPGFNLRNSYVFHAVGPIYGVDEPSAELLADAYQHTLRLAERTNIRSIGFPAISTGAYGYPTPDAARITLREVIATAPYCWSLKLIRIVLHNDAMYEIFAKTLKEFSGLK